MQKILFGPGSESNPKNSGHRIVHGLYAKFELSKCINRENKGKRQTDGETVSTEHTAA
jgi:hypothetical protein